MEEGESVVWRYRVREEKGNSKAVAEILTSRNEFFQCYIFKPFIIFPVIEDSYVDSSKCELKNQFTQMF